MIGDYVWLDIGLEKIAQDFQCNVGHYREVNGTMVGETQSSNSINVDAFPETLKVFVTVDAVEDCFQLEIRIVRQIDQKIRTGTVLAQQGRTSKMFSNSRNNRKILMTDPSLRMSWV